MTEIAVTCSEVGDDWACDVRLQDPDGSATSHRVEVSQPTLEQLAPGAARPDDLVRRSFQFLLSREPKESILPTFELPAIGRYFPEYEREIRR